MNKPKVISATVKWPLSITAPTPNFDFVPLNLLEGKNISLEKDQYSCKSAMFALIEVKDIGGCHYL